MIQILFIGDIVGAPGRNFVMEQLQSLCQERRVDLVVANAENAAGGSGLNKRLALELLEAGVDAITLGDHVWDQRGFEKDIASLDRVCRPANLPQQCPGRTHLIIEHNGFRLGIATVLGRHFMQPKVDCPFQTADRLLKQFENKADGVLMEIHAEATSEKISFGWYMDGRASGVVGTHTHVPTADARILPRKATGYITDVGMTGPYRSCLGREIQPVLGRFMDGMPRKFGVASEDVRLCGALLSLNPDNGRCTLIERIEVRQTPEATNSTSKVNYDDYQ